MSKDKTVSMRLTGNENKIIKKRAEEKGLSLSRYMVQAAIADEGLTDKKKQQIYLYKVKIQDPAKQIMHQRDDENAERIYEEMEKLWLLLK